MFPPQSTPSKRRVESYRIYKRPYSACSQSSRPSPSSYEKATHGRLVGSTLSTPRGDNNYNQYRPLCEVCPRDRDKVVGTLQGFLIWSSGNPLVRWSGTIFVILKEGFVCLFVALRRINPCGSLASDGIKLNMIWMERVKICKIK